MSGYLTFASGNVLWLQRCPNFDLMYFYVGNEKLRFIINVTYIFYVLKTTLVNNIRSVYKLPAVNIAEIVSRWILIHVIDSNLQSLNFMVWANYLIMHSAFNIDAVQ